MRYNSGMIRHIDISGVNYELEESIKRYVRRKVGRLDRFVPRRARESLHAEVRLRQPNKSHGNRYECEVILHVPEEQLMARDSTMNMFAAVDIVEEKMKNLLHKYKEKHSTKDKAAKGGGWMGRFKRRRDNQLDSKIAPLEEEI